MSGDETRRRTGGLRSGLMLMFGTGSEVLMPFVRSFALTHLLLPHEFGLATALAVAVGFIELVADIGVHVSAVRQGGGPSDADVLPTLHAILLIRATVIGLVLAAGGGTLAQLFGAPEAAWSFSLLGFASFIRGFSNLNSKQLMRHFDYGPEAVVNASGQIIWSGLTIAFALVLGDYRCMLVGIIAGAVGQVAISHLVATVPYRLGWSRAAAREALIFGAPLIPNGIALALAGMGDRFFIGSMLGLHALAIYNIASMAAYMPRSVVLRLVGAVIVPAFIKTSNDGPVKSDAFDYWAVVLSAVSSLYALSFLCFGGFLVGLVFGRDYTPSQEFATLLSVSVYLKFMITLPTPAALAFGQTRFILATSVIAGIAILCGAAAVWYKPDLTSFVMGVAAWEFLALLFVLHRTMKLYPLSPRPTWFSALAPLVVLGWSHYVLIDDPPDGFLSRIETFAWGGLALATIFTGTLLLSKPAAVRHLVRRVRRVRVEAERPAGGS